jgi:hypothetical protein
MRNANLAFLVGMAVTAVGCWLAGWDVDDREAAPIVFSTFATGFTVLSLLERRWPTKLPDKSFRSRR